MTVTHEKTGHVASRSLSVLSNKTAVDIVLGLKRREKLVFSKPHVLLSGSWNQNQGSNTTKGDFVICPIQEALVAENLAAMQETWVARLGQGDPWRRDWLPTLVFWPGELYGQGSLYLKDLHLDFPSG